MGKPLFVEDLSEYLFTVGIQVFLVLEPCRLGWVVFFFYFITMLPHFGAVGRD